MTASVVGTSVPRLEDPPLIRGQARFVDDISRPGMVHAAFVRSPHAHAQIRSIDTSAARALPGVVAVITAEDLLPLLTTPLLKTALPSPAFQLELHRPVLASHEVVHVGEAIAMVVAESRYIAEDAVALVAIDFDELPAVADCVAALHSTIPLRGSNWVLAISMRRLPTRPRSSRRPTSSIAAWRSRWNAAGSVPTTTRSKTG